MSQVETLLCVLDGGGGSGGGSDGGQPPELRDIASRKNRLQAFRVLPLIMRRLTCQLPWVALAKYNPTFRRARPDCPDEQRHHPALLPLGRPKRRSQLSLQGSTIRLRLLAISRRRRETLPPK